MLKAYVTRYVPEVNPLVKTVSAVNVIDPPSSYVLESDGLIGKDVQASCGRLSNSAILATLSSYLSYLSENQRNDIVELIHKYPTLFSDVPSQTNVLMREIEVGQSTPIKQQPYRVNIKQ